MLKLILFSISLLFVAQVGMAHSGNTDDGGCHEETFRVVTIVTK